MADRTTVVASPVNGKVDVYLSDDFNGQVVLHCTKGKVMRYEVRDVRSPDIGDVELLESSRSS